MLGFDCHSTRPSVFGRSMRGVPRRRDRFDDREGCSPGLPFSGEICMSRNVIGVVAAFALLVGGAMATTQTEAVAGLHCGGPVCGGHVCGGGLFAKLKARHSSCCAPVVVCEPVCPPPVVHHCGGKVCGGGLFARLRARLHSNCCAPEPVCCPPEPVCCTPEPVCCAAPAPCCGTVTVVEPCCTGVIVSEEAVEVESSSDDAPPAPEAEST